MITKLIIPVINTEDGKYEYKGNLSRQAYEEMVMDNFLKTDRQVSQFVDDMMHERSNRPQFREYSAQVERDFPEIKYNFYETEAFIQDSKKNDIQKDFFEGHIEKGDMFIILININPNSLDNDAESEVRFWLDDSKRIHNDKSLDTETKLKALPVRGLKIKLDEKEAVLEGCKILQDYSNQKFPFYFAIIVNKIVY